MFSMLLTFSYNYNFPMFIFFFPPTLETMDIGFAVLNDILSQYKLIAKNINFNFVFLKLCNVFLFWI